MCHIRLTSTRGPRKPTRRTTAPSLIRKRGGGRQGTRVEGSGSGGVLGLGDGHFAAEGLEGRVAHRRVRLLNPRLVLRQRHAQKKIKHTFHAWCCQRNTPTQNSNTQSTLCAAKDTRPHNSSIHPWCCHIDTPTQNSNTQVSRLKYQISPNTPMLVLKPLSEPYRGTSLIRNSPLP